MERQEYIIKSLDGSCLVDTRYIVDINELLNCKVGSIVRVTDIHKAITFIDYPAAAEEFAI